jgi:hypothetical protein
MSLKDFNMQYMVGREGRADDEDLPSTSKSSSSSSATKVDQKEMEEVEKTPEHSKDKLVENDMQW